MRACLSLAFLAVCGLGFGMTGQLPPPGQAYVVAGSGQSPLDASRDESTTELEAKVEANSEDLIARATLIKLYARTNSAKFAPALFWLIENHPESSILAMYRGLRPSDERAFSPSDNQHAKALWDAQLAKHPESPAVLLNGATFLSFDDPDRAVQLLETAHKLDSWNPAYLRAAAGMYGAEMVSHAVGQTEPAFTVESADALKAILMSSNDPQTLSSSGLSLTQVAGLRDIGLELIRRAVSIDPISPLWATALTMAVNQSSASRGPVTIGTHVAEANLVKKVEPEYPPLAKTAGIQGTVEFTVNIGQNGSIQNVVLVRGHPLLVNAAKDAVLQWKYRPTLLNGTPVAIITNVIVPFNLVQ